MPGYFWSEDSRYILYSQDKGGNENYHVYAVDPEAEPGDNGVPPGRDLTPLENVRAFIYATPEGSPEEILIVVLVMLAKSTGWENSSWISRLMGHVSPLRTEIDTS